MTRARRSIALAVLSLLLGGAAAADLSAREESLKRRLGPLGPVLVTSKPVAGGGWIGTDSLAVRMMPRRWIPAGVLVDLPAGDRLVAAVSLPAGAMLGPGAWRSGRLAASEISAGQRATTVLAVAPVASLTGGAKVDVLARDGDGKTRRVVAAAVLLAWRRAQAGDQPSVARVEADIATSLDGALEIASAQGTGAELQLLPVGEG